MDRYGRGFWYFLATRHPGVTHHRDARPAVVRAPVAGLGGGVPYALGCCAAMGLFLPGVAFSQLPNAGQSMREIESVRPALPAASAPELSIERTEQAAPAPEGVDAGPRVTVRAFAIGGNRVFTSAQLEPLLQDLTGRELSFGELQAAAARITSYYREHGYVLARAYLPRQDIDDGVVRIDVLEGRYDRIELHNRSRVLDGVVRQPLSALRPGEAVRGADLARSLLLVGDLPGVDAKGTLRSGRTQGSTDLVIDADPGPIATGTLEADNYGNLSTGRYRLTGSIAVNSPLRIGDRLTLRGMGSDTLQRYYSASYQLPVGPWSTRVGVGYSNLHSKVGEGFEELDLHSRANIQSAFVVQPLLRGRAFNLNAQLQYENKNLHDDYRAFQIQDDKNVGLWTFTLSGNGDDALLGGGTTAFSVSAGAGRLRTADVLGAQGFVKTRGTFKKLGVSVMRLQALGSRFQFYTQFSGQLSSGNLDASEQFSLGGPYGVRAYTLGSGSGDQGWQASAELRYAVAPGWRVSTFVDAGRVGINKHRVFKDTNIIRMQAAGFGAGWYGKGHQVTVAAAWPFASSEGLASSAGSPRIWFQATQYF
ncbi:ShlB/FhaC/HecB family hemolysin secretion/activation protein [Burkholderia semiarida]|nr:ShlB/FhaC/HecB family hemolysin secretion/activation protein [Burkholderia semiarida]MDF3103519.1 ShlB/FhaC/HecB family hemolysin secretion/activation protein [Burkholderia semiarida]